MLTAKIVRGACGASYLAIGRDYLACQAAERRGPCGNRARVRRSRLEAQVLEALGTQLMQPEAVAEFVAEFTAEWNRLRSEATAGLTARPANLMGCVGSHHQRKVVEITIRAGSPQPSSLIAPPTSAISEKGRRSMDQAPSRNCHINAV